MLELNNNKEYVEKIIEGININGGHCPCSIFKSSESRCKFSENYLPEKVKMSEICINGQEENRCICGLYIKPIIFDKFNVKFNY